VYTINGASASKRYPQIVRDAARMEGSAIIDAEVVWFDSEGTPDFDVLYRGVNDGDVSACAFDLLMLNGEDFRCKPYVTAKQHCESLCSTAAASSTSSTPKLMANRLFEAVCRLGLEGIVSKKLDAPYSGPSKTWIKIKNRRLPLRRVQRMEFSNSGSMKLCAGG